MNAAGAQTLIMTYRPGIYQGTVGNAGYKAVLAVAAVSFGIGFFANKYLSEREHAETRPDRIPPGQAQRAGESPEKTTLSIEKRDGTIESIIVDSDNIIMCTEEDIKVTDHLFGITPKTR